jgi:pimeloyl-ACP methyl ester carboxylesterase
MAPIYPRIACPTLILRATEGMATPDDLLLPPKVVNSMIEKIPSCRCVDIRGANHYTIVFQPNKTRDEAILGFLED